MQADRANLQEDKRVLKRKFDDVNGKYTELLATVSRVN